MCMLSVVVVTPTMFTLSKFVCPSTSISPLQSIPFLAVTTPIESTFLTSSYVRTPPTVRLPVNVAEVPTIFPENPPLKLDAVTIPDEFIFLGVISPVVI